MSSSYFFVCGYHAIFNSVLNLDKVNVSLLLALFDLVKKVKHFQSNYFLEFNDFRIWQVKGIKEYMRKRILDLHFYF